MANIAEIDTSRLPRHVAVIMDGNGRWATSRGLDRSAGHVEGVKTVRRITEAASETGIEYLTLYTFSTENWNRPKAEVDALMHLIVIAIERETPDLIKNNVRLRMIGDASLPRHANVSTDASPTPPHAQGSPSHWLSATHHDGKYWRHAAGLPPM